MTTHFNSLGQPIGFPVPDWQPVELPSRTEMSGRFCRLEALDAERHAQDLFDAFGVDTNAFNWTYLPYGPFAELTEFRSWLDAQAAGNDPLFYVVTDLHTGRAVGVAAYLRIQPELGVIEVGHIHFSPLLQRTPMATEAMYLMMKRVFDELGYRRYEWKCDALNAPSRRAAERFGFQYEGTFRQLTMYRGRNRDTAWFSIIDKEWPEIKAAFERWLAAENFDQDAQQVTRLTARS
ncbi:MAG: GNAT family protein [Thiolinea sp.]